MDHTDTVECISFCINSNILPFIQVDKRRFQHVSKLAHVKSYDENYRTLWIMTTKMHSTVKILKFANLPLILAIFIDISFQSLRMVGASVEYMLKSPFVDQNIKIKCKKRCILRSPQNASLQPVFMATVLIQVLDSIEIANGLYQIDEINYFRRYVHN